MQLKLALLPALLAGSLATSSLLYADETADTIHALKKQIEELDQKVRILERKREIDVETTSSKTPTGPRVELGANGLTVNSADTNFVFKIRGYVQMDGRVGVGETAGPFSDTFLMRRIRPIFEGTLYRKLDYRIMLDFGSGVTSSTSNDGFVQDAYANLRLLPELQIQVGKMKEPVGLERLQSGANLLFVERAFPTLLVPNRNVGAMLQGDLFGQVLSYQAGVFNGATDGGSTDFQAFDAGNTAGRLFTTPFKNSGVAALEGFGVGVAGTYGRLTGPMRSYLSPGQRAIFSYLTGVGALPNVVADGQQWRLSPQGYYYWGPFGIFGEYVVSSQDVRQAGGGASTGTTATLANRAWQVAGAWFLTGEKNSWKPVNVKEPVTFSSKGGWGAVELVARVQGIHFDDDAFPIFANPKTSPSSAFGWGVGVNWHLNRNLKVSLDFENTEFTGGKNNPITANNEQVIFGQIQVSF